MPPSVGRVVTIVLMAAVPLATAAQTAAPSLIELYRQALATHPALQAQRFSVDRAEARYDIARSRLRLQASASISAARNDFRGQGTPRDEYDSQRHSLTLRQPLIDLASSRQAESEALRIEQARQELEVVRTDLAAELVERMLDVLDASEELVVVQGEKEAVAGQRGRLRSMVDRQMAKVTELLEVEAYHVTLEAREIDKRNAVLVALERLRETSGAEVGALRPLAAGRAPELADSLEDWIRRGADQSSRLAAARSAIQAEQRSVAGSRAQHFPQLALTASKAWADSDSDSRRNPPFNVASIGLQLSIPIYEGGRTDATVRDALAREAIARAQLEERRREVEREVRTAWLKVQGDRLRIDATLQSVQAQERARDAQQRGFELRAVTVVDLLETQRRLYRARADHVRARHDHLRSMTALRRHAGAFTETDLELVSALFSDPPRGLR